MFLPLSKDDLLTNLEWVCLIDLLRDHIAIQESDEDVIFWDEVANKLTSQQYAHIAVLSEENETS